MRYTIGLVYWSLNRSEPFESVQIFAHNKQSALSLAASILKPNHLQALTVMEISDERRKTYF